MFDIVAEEDVGLVAPVDVGPVAAEKVPVSSAKARLLILI